MANPEEHARLEQTKMSFGEHLEELRSALFKSIAALFVGFLVGLYFGQDIVDYIQTPLRASLERFYLRQSQLKQEKRLTELRNSGKSVDDEYVKSAEEMAAAGLLPHEYYLSPYELAEALKQDLPEFSEALAASDVAKDKKLSTEHMIPIRLYQRMEEDARVHVVALNAQEPFVVYIRTSFVAGIVLASPFIFYFIWEFIAAGLYRQEQSYVYTYLPISLALFIAGAMLAFYFAFIPLLDFLFWFCEQMHIEPDPRLSEWISFVLLLPLGFGVSFQLPLGMLLLERIGVFTVDNYLRKWRAAVVVISIIAMLLTPSPDPYSMLLMGVPLVGLYFAGIWMCKHMPRSSPTAIRAGR